MTALDLAPLLNAVLNTFQVVALAYIAGWVRIETLRRRHNDDG